MKRISLLILSVFIGMQAFAFSIESTRFHCDKDTIKINQLLKEGIAADLSTSGEYMVFFAEKLLGTPYVAHTLEGDKEYLTINIHELDCSTFIETLMSLTLSAQMKSPTWYTFASNLEKIRYHSGELNGYGSRLHYVSAWVVENTSRGIIEEVTNRFPDYENVVKSLYFMTAHRKSYPAMQDDAVFEDIKNLESGYNMHMYPILPKGVLMKKDVIAEFRDGDIIALTTKIEGLDVTHFGIIKFVKGKPHLLHASSNKMKVIVDKYDLYEMLRPSRSCTGVRVIRLKQQQ